MSDRGIPRRDGSGRGVGANRGRGGCTITRLHGRRLANRRPRRGWIEVRQR